MRNNKDGNKKRKRTTEETHKETLCVCVCVRFLRFHWTRIVAFQLKKKKKRLDGKQLQEKQNKTRRIHQRGGKKKSAIRFFFLFCFVRLSKTRKN